jgi:hypothetical protein
LSATIEPTKADWVRRVLGVSVPGAAPAAAAPAADWRTAREGFRDATEAVDDQITVLAAAMRASGDEIMEAIADRGMNALTAGHKVKLMAAIMDVGSGDRAAMLKAGPKTIAMARQFQDHIESDERVAACEDNPFGVALTIRATLGPALATLIATIEAGLKS